MTKCVFRALLVAGVWLLRGRISKPAPRASIPKSGLYVTLHVLSLANTFLGQRSTAHEEGGCRCVSEGPGAMLGSHGQEHLAPPMGSWRRVAGQHLACEKLKQVAKLSSGRRKQTAMGGLCKQLLGCPVLGLLRGKKPVWDPGPGSRWAPRLFCPQEPSTVQTGLSSRARSCRANVMEQPRGGCLDVPWECGSPP